MKRRRTPAKKLVTLLLVVAVAVAGAVGVRVALERLGYCVEDVLPGDAELSTDPYVQLVTRDSAIIHWWTADETGGTVSWGAGGQFDNEIEVEAGELHAAVVTGLEAGQKYQYRVKGEGVDAEGTFQAAPSETATVTIGVVGDTGTGSDAQHDVAEVLLGMNPNFALITGDVVYRRGALCDYDDKFFEPYANLIASTPMYAAVGNHDLLAEDGAAFDAVFGFDDRPERWISFDYGPVHVVVLDSEVYQDSDIVAIEAQRAWLDADLQATSLPWTVVALHRPLFSSTEGQADINVREDLAPIFARHEVDLVLSGHAHNYERFAPIDGVAYVVTGGGGAALHEMEPGAGTAAWNVAYHAVRLDVSPKSLSITAVDREGKSIDEVRLDKTEG